MPYSMCKTFWISHDHILFATNLFLTFYLLGGHNIYIYNAPVWFQTMIPASWLNVQFSVLGKLCFHIFMVFVLTCFDLFVLVLFKESCRTKKTPKKNICATWGPARNFAHSNCETTSMTWQIQGPSRWAVHEFRKEDAKDTVVTRQKT